MDNNQQDAILYIVATPIGNIKDITHRAIETLQTVDFIACEDTRNSGILLQKLGIKSSLIAYHNNNEQESSKYIIAKLKQGLSCALISDAGTPLISDPGYRLVSQSLQENIKVVPIPGACALIAALCVSGVATDKFNFAGFLPAKQNARAAQLQLLQHETITTIFYESPHRIVDSLRDIFSVLGGSRSIVLIRELTKIFEIVKKGSVSEILELVLADNNHQKGEIVLIIEGIKNTSIDINSEIHKMLVLLLEDLPLNKACGIIAKLTGVKKNELYKYALQNIEH